MKSSQKNKRHYFQGNKDKNVHLLHIRNDVSQKIQNNIERKKCYLRTLYAINISFKNTYERYF